MPTGDTWFSATGGADEDGPRLTRDETVSEGRREGDREVKALRVSR